MHIYDVPGHRPFQPVPPSGSPHRPSREVAASRPVHDHHPGGPSATPIYDALYAEWIRSFRTLPGDRHGEEHLEFKAFGLLGRGSNSFSSSGLYSSYSAGAQTTRQIAAQHGHTSMTTAVWQTGTRQHGTGTQHVPAALPPAPRRGV